MVLFCERCHQQRLICQALLFPNSVGNTSAFRSFQIAPKIPATHHLTLPPLVLNLIFPLTRGHHSGGLSFSATRPTSTNRFHTVRASNHTSDVRRSTSSFITHVITRQGGEQRVIRCLSRVSSQAYSTRMRNAKSPALTFIVMSK